MYLRYTDFDNKYARSLKKKGKFWWVGQKNVDKELCIRDTSWANHLISPLSYLWAPVSLGSETCHLSGGQELLGQPSQQGNTVKNWIQALPMAYRILSVAHIPMYTTPERNWKPFNSLVQNLRSQSSMVIEGVTKKSLCWSSWFGLLRSRNLCCLSVLPLAHAAELPLSLSFLSLFLPSTFRTRVSKSIKASRTVAKLTIYCLWISLQMGFFTYQLEHTLYWPSLFNLLYLDVLHQLQLECL